MSKPRVIAEGRGEEVTALKQQLSALEGRLQQAQQALRREEALGRIRERIMGLRRLEEVPGGLEEVWVQELRGLGIPINKISLQFPSAREGYFSSYRDTFLSESRAVSGRLADYPWVGEAWARGRPVVVDQKRLRQTIMPPEVQSLVEVPLPGGGSLGVNSLREEAFGEEAVQILQQVAGLLVLALQYLQDLEKYRAHEAQMRAAIDGMHDSYIAMDADGLVVEWNAQAAATFGWSHAEALGTALAELIIPPRLRRAHREGLQRVLVSDSGPVINRKVEVTAMRRDGSEFPVELAVSRVPGRGRELFSAFLRDLTERRKTEQNFTIDLALQQVRNAILQMKNERGWQQVATIFAQQLRALIPHQYSSINMVDRTRGSLLAHSISPEGVHQEITLDYLPRALVEALDTGKPVYRRNRGQIEEYRDPIKRVANAVLDVPFAGGTVAINSREENAFSERDIQILERFAQVLNEGHRRLEDLKSLALQEEQLHQAQKLEAIGQLATGVAHEINNPLTSVLGYSELLLRKELDPQVRQHLQTIYQEGQRAHQIAARLLQFVRRQKSSLQPLSLNPLVEETLALVRQQFELDHVQLNAVLAADLPQVQAHPGQIQQLLLALLQNSREAFQSAGRAEGRICVQTSAQGGWVRLAVEDDGPGIPAGLRERIFEPFFTTKEVGSGVGVGLGLSLCYSIAQGHGGRLWAAPRSAGACLVLELPAETGPVDSRAKEMLPDAR